MEGSSKNDFEVSVNETEEDFLVKYKSSKPSSWCYQPCCKVPRIVFFFIIPLVLIVLVLVGYFIVFPPVVQVFVNDSNIQFSSIQMLDPKRVSFTLNATFSISNYGSATTKIDSMPLEVYYQDQLLGTTNFPDLDLGGDDVETFQFKSSFSLSNVYLFEAFVLDLLNTKGTIDWVLKGQASVVVWGNSMKINLNKQISLQGLGGFSNFHLDSFSLPRDWGKGGAEVDITGILNNPSFVTVYMGNITFDLLYKNSFLGRVYAASKINPGDNKLSFQGYFKPQNSTLGNEFFSNYINGIDSELVFQGKGVNNSATWLTKMTQNIRFSETITGIKNATILSDINFNVMGLNFDSNDQVFLNGVFVGTFSNPFGFSIQIQRMALNGLSLFFQNTQIATLNIPLQPCIYRNGQFSFNFSNSLLVINNDLLFSKFVSQLVNSQTVSVGIQTFVSLQILTQMGPLILNDIPIQTQISLTGLNNFNYFPIKMPSMNVTSANSSNLNLNTTMVISNPSSVAISVNIFPVKFYYEGMYIGDSSISSFNLNSNSEYSVFSDSDFDQSNQNSQVIEAFFSNFMQNQPSILNLKGNTERCTNKYLLEAYENLNSSLLVQGFDQNLITFLHLTFDWIKIFQGIIPTEIYAMNPWKSKIEITGVNVNIYLTDNMAQIGVLKQDLSSSPFILNPNRVSVSSLLDIQLNGLTPEEVKSLVGSINLTIVGTLNTIIGNGFAINFQFRQSNINASFTQN